ncbi:hypothetical protein AEAC466_02930 [Asticcacaulis sp. AC466]|uniref:hypothetical protein n=1 Tax=Asticcacaulis sp. AC466 TaxID=1282362 RepID=UPI0003C41253|nr:hypothetical protein [Asticcacaulis sp. AC466]ESQ86163.1 hypothetical protein AEAC466_02930 [Asticcacaulis sp. AC466]
MMRFVTAALAALAVVAAPHAEAAVDIASRMVNHPAADQWGVYGTGEKHQMVKDTTVNGGAAFQVSSAGVGANPWDIQVGAVTSKPIQKGDVILLAVWAKAVTPGAVTVPAVIQQTAAPYTKIGTQTLTLTSDWRLHYVTGTATQDYPAGTAGASLQLATGAQTVALGPVFILDFGPGYSLKDLPRNIP